MGSEKKENHKKRKRKLPIAYNNNYIIKWAKKQE